MTTFHLPIDRSSAVPLHRQIYEGVRTAILGGRLAAGQRVPSSRALAVDLGVSRLPVLTAYDQLLHEGYLDGRVGSGSFVSASLPDDLLRSTPSPDLPTQPPSTRPPSYPGTRARDGHEMGPFRMSLPALDQFPHAAWARIVSRQAHALTNAQMAYGDPAGLMALREAIAAHLRLARAVRCEAE